MRVLYDGKTFTGKPEDIVEAMRNSGLVPSKLNLEAWMQGVAERITWTVIPTDTPEKFLEGLAREGIVKVLEGE